MRVLVMYDHPSSLSGLSVQGDLLYRGLLELGIDVYAVHYQSHLEKEWYYRWFKPDVVVGIGPRSYLKELVLHPQKHSILAVPWLVADEYSSDFNDLLTKLPLILVTCNSEKELYIRQGIPASSIEVLPIGCEVGSFTPLSQRHPQIRAIRESLDILPEQIMILSIGSDSAFKGAQVVLHALGEILTEVPDWKYICKVSPQFRQERQVQSDFELATDLNIEKKVSIISSITSRNFMPYLMAAADIYVAPSEFEEFGTAHIEAAACEKPVVGFTTGYLLDTVIPNKTAFLAEGIGDDVVNNIALHLKNLMTDSDLRRKFGKAARRHVSEYFDHKLLAKSFISIMKEKLEII